MGDGHSRTSVRLSPGGIERELKDFQLRAVTWEKINLTDFLSATCLQFPSQLLQHLPNGLLVPPVPPPLPLLRSLHQPSLPEDGHVMRNGRLR
jgi:hypothetical protein